MHIAEGILPPSHALGWSAIAAPFFWKGAQSVRAVFSKGDQEKRAVHILCAGFLFAGTIFPIPIPVLGVTSHLCFTTLVAVLIGPWQTVFYTALILFVQALLFAHGGLTSLGANTFSLGAMGAFIGFGLIRFSFMIHPSWKAVGLAAFVSDLTVYLMDAWMLALAFHNPTQGHPTSAWFQAILTGFAPVQIPLAVLEGYITVYILKSIASRRIELLPEYLRSALIEVSSPASRSSPKTETEEIAP
jgi:cobalt/nickel transport system permease protein